MSEHPKVTVYPAAYAYGYKENSWELMRATPGMFRDINSKVNQYKIEKAKSSQYTR